MLFTNTLVSSVVCCPFPGPALAVLPGLPGLPVLPVLPLVTLSRPDDDDDKRTKSDDLRPESALPISKKRDRHTLEDTLPLPLERPAKRPHRTPDLEVLGNPQYRRNLSLAALSVVVQHWGLSWCSLCVSPSALTYGFPSIDSLSTSSLASIACSSSWARGSLSTTHSTTIWSAIPCSISLSQSPRSRVAVVHRLVGSKDFFFTCAAEKNLSRLLEIAQQTNVSVDDYHIYHYNSYNNTANNINTNNNINNNTQNTGTGTGTGTVEESCLARSFRALSSMHDSLFSSIHSPLPTQSLAAAAEEVGESYEAYESWESEDGHCDEVYAEAEEEEEEESSPHYCRLLGQYLQELFFHLCDIENAGHPMQNNTQTAAPSGQFMVEFAMRSFLLFAHQRLRDRYEEEISTLEETEFPRSPESHDLDHDHHGIWVALSQINSDLEHLEKCALSLFLASDLVWKRCRSTSCEDAMSVLEQASVVRLVMKLVEEFSAYEGGGGGVSVSALSESLSSLVTQFSYSTMFLPMV